MATDINCTVGRVTVGGRRPDVVQVRARVPDDGDGRRAPGAVRFQLLNSHAGDTVHRGFEQKFSAGALPADPYPWHLCTPANGYTHSQWNAGADNWAISADADALGGYLLAASGRGVALAARLGAAGPPITEGVPSSMTPPGDPHGRWVDIVARVRWHTGAVGGIAAEQRFYGTSAKTGYMTSVGFEIDGSVAAFVTYHPTWGRGIRNSASFAVADGEWVWLRFQGGTWGTTNGPWFRGKAWKGEREDEPDTWLVGWDYGGETVARDHRWEGNGFRCQQGAMDFDYCAIADVLDPAYLSRFTVEVNGIPYSIPAASADFRSAAMSLSIGSREIEDPQVATHNELLADATVWDVGLYVPEAMDPNAQEQTVEVLWDDDGTPVSLGSWSFSTARFPADAPAYDPAAGDDAPGDPTRMGSFANDAAGVTPAGGYFAFLVEALLESMGAQGIRYNVAPVSWPGPFDALDFAWNLIAQIYTPVDGEYIIAHPVWSDVPGSVVPALVAAFDAPGSVVAKASMPADFPASVVPQAWTRSDFPASVCPTAVLWWDGDASVVVSAEMLTELDASCLSYMFRRGSTMHLRVIDESTWQAALSMGVVLTPIVRATVGRLVVAGLAPHLTTSGIAHATVGALTAAGHRPAVTAGTLIRPGVGTVTVAGHDPNVALPLDIAAGAGAVTVAGHDPEVWTGIVVAAGVGAVSVSGHDPDVSVPAPPTPAFKAQRGTAVIASSATTATITAGTDYDAPASVTRAYIRLVDMTQNGVGPTSGGANPYPDHATVWISDPGNLLTSITFQRHVADSSAILVAWEIIEYVGPAGGANEMVVREVGVLSGYATKHLETGAISVTDDADVMVSVTGRAHNNPYSSSHLEYVLYRVAWDAVNHKATFDSDYSLSRTSHVSYAIVEWTGANWTLDFVYWTDEPARWSPGDMTYGTTAHGVTIPDLSKAAIFAFEYAIGGTDQRIEQDAYRIVDTANFRLWMLNTSYVHRRCAWILQNSQDVAGARPFRVQSCDLANDATGSADQEIWTESLTGHGLSAVDAADESTTACTISVNTGADLGFTCVGHQLTGVNEITFTRCDATAEYRIAMQVIEFPEDPPP